MEISVYLSRRKVDIVCGSSSGVRLGKKRARLSSVYSDELPDGCMINGIITDENELTEAMAAIWEKYSLPKKPVMAAVDSTQFANKRLTVPIMSDRKLRELVENEFGDLMTRDAPLYDCMTLSGEPDGRRLVLASSVESSFVASYIDLFEKLGCKLKSLRPALACVSALTADLAQFRGKCAILLALDGDVCTSYLASGGVYMYSSASRLLGEEGSPEFNAEIGRAISKIQQFHASEKLELPLTDVFFAGFDDQSVDSLISDVKRAYLLNAERLGNEKCVKMPAPDNIFGAVSGIPGLGDHIYAVGNLLL